MTMSRRLSALLLSVASVAASFAQPAFSGESQGMRYANGIAAIAEDKVITADDVRREVAPYVQQLQKDAKSEKEFNDKLEDLQNNMIQELIDRVLIVKEFYKKKDGDNERHIPASYVDNSIADRLSEQFDNDRSKFLAYLRSKGQTLRDYRKEVEEDIIYNYMKQQQRKSQSVVSPVRIETFYKENKDQFFQEDKVHLRLIQLSRANGATDAELTAKAKEIVSRLKGGAKFEDLAKEFSEDQRRAKGGDWGWMGRNDLKAEFSEPMFKLKAGEFTDPILIPEGCYLLFAEDRKYAGVQPIDQVRDQIERILQTQMTRSGQERWLERLRRNGYVKHY